MSTPAKTVTSPATDAMSKAFTPHRACCRCGYSRPRRLTHWALLLCLLALPTIVSAQFTYTTNGGTITITGYTGPGGAVTIPSTINGLPVVGLTSNALGTICSPVTALSVPSSLTNIESHVFDSGINLTGITVDAQNAVYSSLDGVLFNKNQTMLLACPGTKSGVYTIPDTVTGIGTSAFYGCFRLTGITIPDTVTSIGAYAFCRCQRLTTLSIPGGVTNFEDFTFSGCTQLGTVTMGTNVIAIGDQAFFSCTNLTSIAVPNVISIGAAAFQSTKLTCADIPRATLIGDRAFSGCANLTNVSLSSAAKIGVQAFYYCTELTGVSLPNATSIGMGAFLACTNMTSLEMGTNLTAIGGSAFCACNLASVRIPQSVTNIANRAFFGCLSLQTIMVDTQNVSYSSLDGVLFNKEQTMLVAYPSGRTGGYIIPDGVTCIRSNAFDNYCIKLTSITFPNSVTNIGASAFNYCYRLTSLTIPDSVSTIGDSAFVCCFGLTNVYLGSGIKSIARSAFQGCDYLKGVYFYGNAPSLGQFVFAYADEAVTTVYYLPGATGWSATFGGQPTALWRPQMQAVAKVGLPTNQFGFTIDWANGRVVVVETCTNLSSADWVPFQTNKLTSDSFYFSDPQWTNYPTRLYRLRWP